jgi:hypothetical protein
MMLTLTLARFLRPPQAAQPAYMKTNSGRVLEMPKTEEGPTTQQELQELTTTYEATVRFCGRVLGTPASDQSTQSPTNIQAWPCLLHSLTATCEATVRPPATLLTIVSSELELDWRGVAWPMTCCWL